jgi:hypothetical protein
MTRCALCGGRLGLISHRTGSLRFCRRAHKAAYERQRAHGKAEDRRRSWLDFLSRRQA